ncbi:UDP-N-acetylmuramoyl-L-alanine--D-glutamate ligase [Sphingomonas crusticola]|uniref:UDP-N-acetylmuramoyl-L-alanine--D-glutamate ligase n=1 Tax=Sphingomonas crusticola TaxID=1697973 RepID=UPI000E26F72F|nr:UDP-N-acetylmuramoyl-L-alanine--D-glutamate ligase [Sphingomonas crusticola]
MITSPAFRGKRYAVLGLARSGVAVVEALLASGATVVAWDSREEARAAVSGVTLADPLEIDLAGFDGVVVSPGVPLNKHPIAAKARAAGVPVIGDIELFALARPSLPPHKVVGITGTNGKSTTTALIHHILETAGVPTLMGGNIGLPILSQDPLPAGGVYVLELSSYQIDLTFSLDCDVAVLTNITPDHLDRYDGFEAYAASKARLFYDMQTSRHLSILVADNGAVSNIADEIEPYREWSMLETDPIGSLNKAEGWTGPQSDWPALQGPHNFENAAVAVEACRYLSVSKSNVAKGLRTYPGLPHRMERVAEKAGVLYVNDSKATNATATAPALAAYPAIHWILGGLPKTDDLDDCAPFFGHVHAGYTIGQAGPMFADILRQAGKPVTESGTLAQAVNDAAAAAQPGEVVMLSPACASFDQFKDYEARGEAFRAAVGAL